MFLIFYSALNTTFPISFIYLYIYFMRTQYLKVMEQSFFLRIILHFKLESFL